MSARKASRPPRSIEEIAARAAGTDRKAEALGLDIQAARLSARALVAMRKLLQGDDDGACEALAKLDGDDLERLEKTTTSLSTHISRLREAHIVLAALDQPKETP